MPRLVGAQATLVPPPPPPPPSRPPVGRATAVWIAPDDSVWPLTSDEEAFLTLTGVAGLGIAPRTITTVADSIGGSRVQNVHRGERFITWPLHVEGLTHMGFLDPMRELAESFGQTDDLGAGILRITRPDGSSRETEAYYEAGWEEGGGWISEAPVLTLRCPDPLFRDPTPIVLTRSHEASAAVYLNPYRTFSTGQVLDESTLVNPGKVDAWPVWVLTGPATGLVATNVTTGKTFTVTYTLTAGQTITITTRPGRITGPAGQNLINSLTWPASTLWGLQPGANDVDLAVLGADTGTSVTCTFYAKYRTA